MILIEVEKSDLKPTAIDDYLFPGIDVLYCSLQDASDILNDILKPSQLKAVLTYYTLCCHVNRIPEEDSSLRYFVTDCQVLSKSFPCQVKFRFACSTLQIVQNPANNVNISCSVSELRSYGFRITSSTQIVLVNAKQTLLTASVHIYDGLLTFPMANINTISTASQQLKVLEQAVKLSLASANSTPSILVEDQTSSQASKTIANIAQQVNAIVISISGITLHEEQILKLRSNVLLRLFSVTKALHKQKTIFLIHDVDIAFGISSIEDMDFESRASLNMDLHSLLEKSNNTVIIALCSDRNALLTPVASAFKIFHAISKHDDNDTASHSVLSNVYSNNITLYGMDDVIHTFDQILLWPRTHKQVFVKFGVHSNLVTGVMIHGPSGSGKSTLPFFFANRYGFTLLQMRPYDVIQSEVGGSERAIIDYFQRAKRESPCILFVDEFASIFSSPQSSLSSVFLSCLDDIKIWNENAGTKATIFVLGATRNIESVGTSFFVPGRFGRTVALGQLSSEGRKQMIGEGLEGFSAGSRYDEELMTLTGLSKGLTAGQLVLALKRTERIFRATPRTSESHGDFDYYTHALRANIIGIRKDCMN